MRLIQNFLLALRGLKVAIYEEASFRFQLFAGIIIIILMLALPLKVWEQVILIFAITLVLALELTNSIVERILDIIEAEHHPKIQDAKDIMAGAVVLACLGAMAVGIIIFWPYLIEIFR